MNKTLLTLTILGALGATSAWADATKKSGAVMKPASGVTFVDVPGAPGVKISVVEGDGAKGPHHFYLKFAEGFSVGAHHHSVDHFGTVVSGTMVLTVDGKDTALPAGSFFSFTDKTKHATRCEKGADCVLFIDARGAWDAVMAEAPKATAKK